MGRAGEASHISCIKLASSMGVPSVCVVMPMPVVVVFAVVVIVAMPMSMAAMRMATAGVGAVLRLKGLVHRVHDQVHGAQHVGQHMVGLDLQVVGLEFNRHMAVAQVVGRPAQ